MITFALGAGFNLTSYLSFCPPNDGKLLGMVSQVNDFLSSVAFDQALVSQQQKGNRIVNGQEMLCSHRLDGKGISSRVSKGTIPSLQLKAVC